MATKQAAFVLLIPGRRGRYMNSLRTAVESFRGCIELDEATLRPVRGKVGEPLTLIRGRAGGVAVVRKA